VQGSVHVRRMADSQQSGQARGQESGPWWYLTRLRIACCAADAVATKVLAVDAAPQPDNQWVTVTGTYLPVGTNRIPRLRVEKVTPIAQPGDPLKRLSCEPPSEAG
jgi:hypothetical protein